MGSKIFLGGFGRLWAPYGGILSFVQYCNILQPCATPTADSKHELNPWSYRIIGFWMVVNRQHPNEAKSNLPRPLWIWSWWFFQFFSSVQALPFPCRISTSSSRSKRSVEIFFLTVNAWHLEPSWWMFHDVSWLDIVKCSGLVTTCQDNLKICFDPSDGTWGWRALMQHVSSFFFRNGTSLAPPLLWMPWNVHQHTLHLNGARTCCTSWISAAGFTMLRDVFSWVSNRDRHR